MDLLTFVVLQRNAYHREDDLLRQSLAAFSLNHPFASILFLHCTTNEQLEYCLDDRLAMLLPCLSDSDGPGQCHYSR